MPDPHTIENDFLSKITEIIEENISNEQFGVSELARKVSEVSYKVGFGSTSYFIKCFHDYYGYPPREVGKRDLDETDSIQIDQSKKKE